MIQKTITFINFNDEKETDTFYFNMSKGELVKQQMEAVSQEVESFQDKLEKIGKNLQGKELVEVLDEIILGAYGEKSTDGKNFVKVRNGVRLAENFMSSGAYSELLVELCTVDGKMAEFINGLVPADLRDSVKKEAAKLTSEEIRKRSEAKLQGHQKRVEPSVKQVPELPVVIEETAEPVLSGEVEEIKPDLNNMSASELRAFIASGNPSSLS